MVKICICSTGTNLNSQVSPVFGRCPYFLIVNSETKEFKVIPNPAGEAGRGAGVGAAQIAASEGVKAVICGNFGPNAFSVLQMVGIKIYPGVFGLAVNRAIDKYNQGELKELKTVPAPDQLAPPGFPGRRRGFGYGPGRMRRRRGRR
jgi:predicted Fe-Mo cluster-binding NifX family protein